MTITATSDNQIRKSNIRNWTIGLQTFATGSLPRSGLVQRKVMEYSVARRSLGLCARELDYFAPFLGIVSDELAEVGDRAGKYHAPKVGKPRLQLGISEPRIDLAIELINDLGRRVFGRTEANPLARLETRHEIAHSGDIRQCL